MSDTTCPHCGGPIVATSPVCDYCGSALAQSNAMGKWTAIKDHLPPASPTDPNRSINVLGCFGMKGGYLKQADGTVVDVYNGSLKSIYYDFQNKEWKNDFYGERMYPIGVTHWMPLPAIGLPDWIPVVFRTPQVAGTVEGISISVLSCDKGLDYEGSVISAQITFKFPHWIAPLDLTNTDEDALGHITVSHWMPQPDRPLK